MTEILKSVLLTVLSENCYSEYFDKYNFLDLPCFKASLSKGLGIGIIAGSILVKIPQILKILKNKSAEGISLIGVYLELFAVTASFAYSYVMKFPFSSWGESTFLCLQTAVIAALVINYGGAPSKAAAFLTLYTGVVAVLISGYAPADVLWVMAASNVPSVIAAKSIQIYTNLKNGSTGQLSAATCIMLFGGSVARIFTSIQETGDFILILTYIVSTIANGLIVAQLVYYWNTEPAKVVNEKKKKR